MDMNINTTASPIFIERIKLHDVILTFVVSSASVIGALVLFYCQYRRRRSGLPIDSARHFLIALTFADMLNAVGQIVGVARFVSSNDINSETTPLCLDLVEPGCIAQSYLTTFSSLSSFFWTTVIAFHLYWTFGENEETSIHADNFRTAFYHFASWGIPFVIVTAAWQTNVLGSDLSVGSGAWCWISACLDPFQRTLWMTVSGKGWELLMYISCLAFYILIKLKKNVHMRRARFHYSLTASVMTSSLQDRPVPRHDAPHEDLRFLFLWLIEITLRVWGTIRYIIAAIRRHSDIEIPAYDQLDGVFLTLQSFGDSAQALCSCVIFCILDSETRQLLCPGCVCCRENQQDLAERQPILRRRCYRANCRIVTS